MKLDKGLSQLYPYAALLLGLVIFLFYFMKLSADNKPEVAEIDQLFTEWNRSDSPGVAVVVIQEGEIIYNQAFGMANLEENIPLTIQSVFEIASLSKQFTAFCIALLIENGQVSLNDDIVLYFSELKHFSDDVIRVKDLIYHTSGLPDYLSFMEEYAGKTEYDRYTVADVLNILVKDERLEFTPGSKYEYSNTNYLLLGEMVKIVSGQSLRQYAQENIFSPLKMYNSHYHDIYNENVQKLALGYSSNKEHQFVVDVTPLDVVGDGGVYTTPEDLFLWDQNFYHNKLGNGSQEIIDLVTTPGLLNDGTSTDYAFGLFVDTYRGLKTIGHSGAFVGYVSEMVLFPDQEFTVILLSNLNTVDVSALAYQIATMYLEHLMEPE